MMLDKNRNIKLTPSPILSIIREILYYIILYKNCIVEKLNFSSFKEIFSSLLSVFQFQFQRIEENGGTPAVCYIASNFNVITSTSILTRIRRHTTF